MRALGGHDAGQAGCAQHVALFRVARPDNGERLRLHDHAAFGHRNPLGRGLVRHVDHAGFAAAAQMAEFLGAAWHRRYRDAPTFPPPQAGEERVGALRVSKARVAAVTSPCRIRLSPTRNVEILTLASRARSSGAKIPLSPTMMRSDGTSRASRSEVASVVSKVLRFRLLMPMSFDLKRVARSNSFSSCTSTSASMPSAVAADSSSAAHASSTAAMMMRMQSAP